MTQLNLQEKISAAVTDRFSDYYQWSKYADRFPHIFDEGGLILGVIIPEEFRVFKQDKDFAGLPVVLYPIKTTFIGDDGDEYEGTQVYIVEYYRPLDSAANKRAALLKVIAIAFALLLSWLMFASCHEDGYLRTTELRDVEQKVIRVDAKTFEHMKEGCTPCKVFYCEECQTWHILFAEYDYTE